MKVLVFGSLNIDYVYPVEHFAGRGETLAADGMEKHVGGKGLNQAIALARAGAQVAFAGNIGEEGGFLKEFLAGNNVDTELIETRDIATGHAIIQVTPDGQNAILLFRGANGTADEAQIENALSHFGSGDILLLQNEINHMDMLIERAKARGLTVALNPSPVNAELLAAPLDKVDLFILNEGEAMSISGTGSMEDAEQALAEKYPAARFVMTLGADGAVYFDGKERLFCPAKKVSAVDTTGAGDTFLGYFLGSLIGGSDTETALRTAAAAAAIEVTRCGAAETIPYKNEIT